MSNFYRAALSLCFVLSIALAHGETLNGTPPDSTSSIVNKTASLYMVEEGKTSFGAGKVRDALIKFRQASVKDTYISNIYLLYLSRNSTSKLVYT